MSEITLKLCRPTERHARLVMKWRNDPITREMSYHHDPKQWETFWPWFCGLASGHQVLPSYFAILGGEPAAHLYFEHAGHPHDPALRCCQASINVAPAHRGRGVGPAALQLAGRDLAKRGWDGIYAEVRQGNSASSACFNKAGFTSLGPKVKVVRDTGEEVAIEVFFMDLREKRQESDAPDANRTAPGS